MMKDTITNYCKGKGLSMQTFYSRLNKAIQRGENYPYPVSKPYSQYDALFAPTTYTKRKEKVIDLDREWERICRKYENADTREIAYLRVLSHIIPIEKEEIKSLQDVHQRKDSKDLLRTFREEIGLKEEAGRPRKN